MNLFGTSGIRGIVGEDITPELCILVGESIGALYDSVIVGYDTRTSNLMLSNAIQSGIVSVGANVFDAGLLTTPTLARATKKFKCGLMITASHNPPEYNGIKFWNTDGSPFDEHQSELVEKNFNSDEYLRVPYDKIGRFENYTTAVSEHINSILDKVNDLNLRVVIDCGNGAASTITPILFRKLGCKVITLNSQPDGHFPGRNPEPAEENLQVLKDTVKSLNYDIGIAHDSDADRMVAIDDKGSYISGDRLLAFFALHEVENKVVIPIDASMAIDTVLEGKTVVRTKVGDVYVAQTIRRENADFGGEPSGTFIFPGETYCPDGVYGAVRLAQIIKTEKKKLSELLSEIPTYPMRRGKIRVHHLLSESEKGKIMSEIEQEVASVGDTATIDGCRVQFDNGWLLVRFSGTEPYVRITAEAETIENTNKFYDLGVKIVEKCLKEGEKERWMH